MDQVLVWNDVQPFRIISPVISGNRLFLRQVRRCNHEVPSKTLLLFFTTVMT